MNSQYLILKVNSDLAALNIRECIQSTTSNKFSNELFRRTQCYQRTNTK